MVVNFGETEVLERHVAKLLHGFVGGNLALLYLMKELFEFVSVHDWVSETAYNIEVDCRVIVAIGVPRY